MKPENKKSILDKLDEIGAPVRCVLEGTEYKGFKPIRMPPLKVQTKSPPKPPSPISQQHKANKKKKTKKKAKRKLQKKNKRRK